jgi:hypothetical protein
MQRRVVCGQCCVLTQGEGYGCPVDRCRLELCSTCSNPEVHLDEGGKCPRWWGEGLSEEEIEKWMREAKSMAEYEE